MDKHSTAFATSVKNAMKTMNGGVRKAPARKRRVPVTAARKKEILDVEWQSSVRECVPILAEGFKYSDNERFLNVLMDLFAKPKEGMRAWVDERIATAAPTETECVWYGRLMRHLETPHLSFGGLARFFKDAFLCEQRERSAKAREELEAQVTAAAANAAAACNAVAHNE